MRILHEKCDPKLAEDKGLPYTAFLVQYEIEGKLTHDIAMSSKAAELFDHYYDKYKKDFRRFDSTAGMVDPRRWNDPTIKPQPSAPPKKKGKKHPPTAEA